MVLAIFFIVIVQAFSGLLALVDLEGFLLILLRLFGRAVSIVRVFVLSLVGRDLIAVALLSLIASVVSS